MRIGTTLCFLLWGICLTAQEDSNRGWEFKLEPATRWDSPTTIIHGADDPLVPVGCGEDVKNSIEGATMTVISGMGHDYPSGAVPAIVDAIKKNADRA